MVCIQHPAFGAYILPGAAVLMVTVNMQVSGVLDGKWIGYVNGLNICSFQIWIMIDNDGRRLMVSTDNTIKRVM
jgi:hypothetical protein